MQTTANVIKYELRDVVRGKWILVYALFFLVVTEALFRFGGGSARALLSLSNLVLILIPLVSIVFGAMYLYNAREFVELLLSQPVDRAALFGGLYAGLALPLSAGFLVGVGLPFAFHGVETASHATTLLTLAVAGVLLTCIFVALAFVIAITFEDKVRGLGVALFLWLFCSVIYDAGVLLLANAFADYPLERPMIALMLLNPIDLARVLLLLTFDISALMGYTGAVFEQFFGSLLGVGVATTALAIWAGVPLWVGARRFKKKDF
jgi:Cu-processing system permease protein